MEKLNVTVSGETGILEVRMGEALPLKEPVKLLFTGTIESVSTFLSQRKGTLTQKVCQVIVSRDKMEIALIINECNPYSGKVTGALVPDPDFVRFGINSAKKWDLRTLSDFIKMNRSYFTSKDDAMKLVELLRNFKGKVEKELEKKSDQRGNVKLLYNQIVDSNIPEAFDLAMPIFKNGEKKTFKVEVNIIARDADMECYLESVEAADIIKSESDVIMLGEIEAISKIAPDIVILYN